MKINAGEYKYRNLEVPEGIRPTTGKVREAIFSMLTGRIEDAVVLDLFAGTGSLGLEALSRGAKHCYFNEGSKKNYKILKNNIENCQAAEKSTVFNSDFRRVFSFIDKQINLIFVDPPYHEGYYGEVFKNIEEYNILSEDGIIIAEHYDDNKLPDNIEGYSKFKAKHYGTIAVDMFSKK